MWCISRVWPSGRAWATRPAAMVPPAPVTFSTTTGWPRSLAMPSATMREITSVGPPAANGTAAASNVRRCIVCSSLYYLGSGLVAVVGGGLDGQDLEHVRGPRDPDR